MVFGDITIFEDMDDVWLEGLIQQPNRIKTEILNPRSAMMLNPLKIKHLNKIDHLDTDIIVINLEDGVAPQMKKRALLLTAVFISHLKNSTSRIVVRVNPIDEGGKEEIKLLNFVLPDVIRVAKIREVSDVKKVLEILHPDIKLHLSIETKEALSNLKELNIDGKVECASLGIMDMLNSMGLPHSLLSINNPTIQYIMSRFLIDSKIAGIFPIGFTYQDYEDIAGYKRWCELENLMGYSAKSCLGPKQVEIANKIFNTKNEEIEKAKYIKKRFEEMAKENITGFMDDKYGFIDEPIYKDALLVLGEN
jgi:citrate lyase subunit beta/citryl-CoA lyase